MGRGRGKRKKLTIVTHEHTGSGEEEKASSVQKRRGRPQKPLKDGIEEEEFQRIGEEDSDNKGGTLSSKAAAVEARKIRKRNSQVKVEEEENSNKPKTNGGLSMPSGFRHTGSRRKSMPHRAAEAGVRIDIFFSIES